MSAKIIIRIDPSDRVEVEVKGLSEPSQSMGSGKRLCERLTHRLEQDLGQITNRTYHEGQQDSGIEFYQGRQQADSHG